MGKAPRTWYDGVSYAKVNPLHIATIAYNAAIPAVTLTWNSIAPESALSSLTYTVLRRTSLAIAPWITVATNLPSAGTTTSYTDTPAPGSAALYRVTTH